MKSEIADDDAGGLDLDQFDRLAQDLVDDDDNDEDDDEDRANGVDGGNDGDDENNLLASSAPRRFTAPRASTSSVHATPLAVPMTAADDNAFFQQSHEDMHQLFPDGIESSESESEENPRQVETSVDESVSTRYMPSTTHSQHYHHQQQQQRGSSIVGSGSPRSRVQPILGGGGSGGGGDHVDMVVEDDRELPLMSTKPPLASAAAAASAAVASKGTTPITSSKRVLTSNGDTTTVAAGATTPSAGASRELVRAASIGRSRTHTSHHDQQGPALDLESSSESEFSDDNKNDLERRERIKRQALAKQQRAEHQQQKQQGGGGGGGAGSQHATPGASRRGSGESTTSAAASRAATALDPMAEARRRKAEFERQQLQQRKTQQFSPSPDSDTNGVHHDNDADDDHQQHASTQIDRIASILSPPPTSNSYASRGVPTSPDADHQVDDMQQQQEQRETLERERRERLQLERAQREDHTTSSRADQQRRAIVEIKAKAEADRMRRAADKLATERADKLELEYQQQQQATQRKQEVTDIATQGADFTRYYQRSGLFGGPHGERRFFRVSAARDKLFYGKDVKSLTKFITLNDIQHVASAAVSKVFVKLPSTQTARVLSLHMPNKVLDLVASNEAIRDCWLDFFNLVVAERVGLPWTPVHARS